jgi:hypothetical protein
MDGTDLTRKVAENTQLFRSRMTDAGFTIAVSVFEYSVEKEEFAYSQFFPLGRKPSHMSRHAWRCTVGS